MNSNKPALVIKLIALSVLLVIVVVFSVVAATRGFAGLSFSLGSGSAQLLSAEEFTGVEELNIDTQSYSVVVEEQKSDAVTVEFYSSGAGKATAPVVEQNGAALTIYQKNENFIGLSNGKVVVKVPEGTVMDYDVLTVSGSIKISVDARSASAATTSGSIKIFGAGDELSADTVSGSIKVYEPFRVISADSISGSVKLTADARSERVDASTTSGSVKIALEGKISGYTMEYDTVSGSVRDEYSGERYSVDGRSTQGDGSLSIDVSTVSGSIALADWTD